MMRYQIDRADLMPATVPLVVVVVLGLIGLAGWVALHWLLGRRGAWMKLLCFAAGTAIGTLTIWLVLSLIDRRLTVASPWTAWWLSVVGAGSLEAVVALYRLERRAVSRSAGLALVVLRCGLVAVLLLMLAQPVLSWQITQTIDRYIAVVLDDSASMRLVDHQRDASEKMRIAALLGYVEQTERNWMRQARSDLQTMVQQLRQITDRVDAMEGLGFAAIRQALGAQIEQIDQQLSQARQTIEAAVEQARNNAGGDSPLSGQQRRQMRSIADRLSKSLGQLDAARRLTRHEQLDQLARQQGRLVAQLKNVTDFVDEVIPELDQLAPMLDAARLDRLAAPVRQQIDQAQNISRAELARTVLLGTDEHSNGLLSQLEQRYMIKLYRFDESVESLDAQAYRQSPLTGEQVMLEDAAADDPHMVSDLAGALAKVNEDIPAARLAGVLVISDGRHNAVEPVSPQAQQVARAAVMNSVVVGSRNSPPDASVLDVDAPQTLFLDDTATFRVTLKLDALAGRSVTVKLLGDDDQVIDRKTIKVSPNQSRADMRFEHRPRHQGVHEYQVVIEPVDGEIIQSNNRRLARLAVTDERTRLLLIEGRPRWEYRYLRNLLTSRDESVFMQYVLLEPDQIKGQNPPPRVAASVSRPKDQPEATALPESEAEWMKFDIILLGDVTPGELSADQQQMIRRFVEQRGGTLIVIAGPRGMPHAFGGAPLAELLPVTVETTDQWQGEAPEMKFELALTDSGRTHPIMQQSKTVAEHLAIWQSMPRMYWRHPTTGAREGATVLAFAMPSPKPALFEGNGGSAEMSADQLMQQRRQFQSDHALILSQNLGLGQTMMLTFDRTWRWRYRVGDRYHHRFWGQVFRWATAGKLRAGTELVRLGTDRLFYSPTQPVQVQAKLIDMQRKPISNAQVAVNIFDGEQLVRSQSLQPTDTATGRYEADLGTLPPGRKYRIELQSDRARQILSQQNVTDAVQTEIVVGQDFAPPAELLDLSADRSLLGRVARLTGGRLLEVDELDQATEGFGVGVEEYEQMHHQSLWDAWPLLVVMMLFGAAEWTLRKRVGLI